jgi:lysophospholipase L1-like esterase
MWGICGWQASSDADSLHFSWKVGDAHFREMDEIGILSPPECRRHALFLKDSMFKMEIPYDENRNGFFIRLPANQSQLHFSVSRSDSTAFHHQGFVRFPSKGGLSLGISGTNGARLDHYLLSRDFEENLRAIHPDLVVLALGTNDAFVSPFDKEKVRLHLGMLVARIRMALPEAAILLIGPPDHCNRRMKINANTLKINEIYAEMAEELELGFWNLQQAMGGEKSAFAWRRKKLITTDMVHFTVDGYQLQAKMLGKALHKAMQSIQVE